MLYWHPRRLLKRSSVNLLQWHTTRALHNLSWVPYKSMQRTSRSPHHCIAERPNKISAPPLPVHSPTMRARHCEQLMDTTKVHLTTSSY